MSNQNSTSQISEKNSETIYFGGGCFWCTEAVFSMIKGVESVTPGYIGGTTSNPTYEEVCSGKTGHAEAVRIVYDPSITKPDDLLTVFFATHDPTTLNRQGADVGTQYRSAIFYENENQRVTCQNFINELNKSSENGSPIVTELTKADVFYEAENYHQEYFAKHPEAPYCQVVINPKLEKVQKNFANLLK